MCSPFLLFFFFSELFPLAQFYLSLAKFGIPRLQVNANCLCRLLALRNKVKEQRKHLDELDKHMYVFSDSQNEYFAFGS